MATVLTARSRRRYPTGPNDRDTDDVSADVLPPLHPPVALYSIDVMGHVERADLRDVPSVMRILVHPT